MEEVRVTTTPASAQFRAISQHLPRFRNKMGAWIFSVCKIKFSFNSFLVCFIGYCWILTTLRTINESKFSI